MKRILVLILAVCLVLSCSSGAAEAARKKAAQARPAVDRYASIVIDAGTGAVLSERNADKPLYPASLTKMMTLYLTFEAIGRGDLYKNQRIPVSSRAAMQEPSRLGLAPGSTLRVEDAILGLVTKSANDVSVVLAEAIGGSESRFAALMTQKARHLGMRNTYFTNASGLHNPSQVSTARDMAILSRALIRDYPRDYRYFKTNSFTYAGVVNNNHNKLMNSYEGMDGIKTGYVYASGYNLAASAARDGRRLIGIVFGGRTWNSRNREMARLLDNAFGGFGQTRVARAEPQPRATATAVTSARTAVAGASPAFNALGLTSEEQGDASDGADTMPPPKVVSFRPSVARAGSPGGAWAVQVGAFTSHDAGLIALRHVRENLPTHIASGGQYMIAPLMTNRGMIYRARLAGLDRDQATSACRALQGSCLILAVQ